MRKLLAIALLGAASLSAQDGTGYWIRHRFAALTSATATPALFTQMSQEGRIPEKHEIEAVVTGSPATCTYELEGSPDGDAPWHSITGEQDCTSSGAVGAINRFFPYVRANITALSSGSVTFTYIGVPQ